MFFHVLKARWADSTAAMASLVPALEDFQIVFERAGDWTSKVVEVVTSLPSIQRGLEREVLAIIVLESHRGVS